MLMFILLPWCAFWLIWRLGCLNNPRVLVGDFMKETVPGTFDVVLATAVFRSYGRSDLLRIGALSRPEVDNLDRTFPRSPCWLLPYYRNPILGVIETLDRVVDRSRLV